MTTQIGRYEVQGELGRGGFGRVFRAHDPTVGRLVAIKTLTGSVEPAMLTRFRNEAAAAGRLHHPNIVVIHDFGEHEGSPYLVMELLDGEDVERIITKRRELTLSRKLDIMLQAANGLHHAHSKGIVHRDVKPANIMVLTDGSVKIMDFGIALVSQATGARLTPQGSVIGTLPYMAPEQLRGSVSDWLTDIFAYGTTFYRLLTGTHPFDAAELGGLMYNIMNKPPTPVREFCPEAPETLEAVIGRLLEKDRELRYQSLDDLRFDLEPIASGLREESVRGLIEEARSRLAADDLEAAQHVVSQVMEIDPGNRTGRELRDRLQRQSRDQEIRPRVVALVDLGREQMRSRQFESAIQKFESALRLDKSNSELRTAITQARAAWEGARRADKLLDEARQALRVDDVTAAHKAVSEALSADPDNPQCDALLQSVNQQMEVHRYVQQLREGLKQIKGLISLQNYTDAIQRGSQLQEEFPESAEIAQLVQTARREQEEQSRQQRLRAGTNTVKELLRNQHLDTAQDQLSHLLEEFPEAEELRNLASYADQQLLAREEAEVVDRTTGDTQRLVSAGNLDGALELLRNVLAEYPGLGPLLELMQSVSAKKAEQQRKRALDDAVRSGAVLTREGRFTEILEQVTAFESAYGMAADLSELRRTAAASLDQRKKALDGVLRNGAVLMREGRFAEILEQIAAFEGAYGTAADLSELRRTAAASLDQRKKALDDVLRSGAVLMRESRFAEILEQVAAFEGAYGTAADLSELRRTAAAGLDQRKKALAEVLRSGGVLMREGRFAEVLEQVAAFENAYGTAADLSELRRTAAASLDQRKRALDDVLRSGDVLMREGRFAEILDQVTAFEGAYGTAADLSELRRTAAASLDQRKRALDDVLRSGAVLMRESRFAEILEQVAAFETAYGTTADLSELRRTAAAGLDQRRVSEFEDADGTATDLGEQPGTAAADLDQRKVPAFEGVDGTATNLGEQPRTAARRRPRTALILSGIGAAAVIATVATVPRWSSPKPSTPVAVEIRTVPEGVSVRIGDRSCVTPQCRLQLAPGEYPIEARANRYQATREVLRVQPGEPSRLVELTLRPEAALPPATGTLLVQTGLPDVAVYVDGTARGRTEASGSMSVTLDASVHEVRVERQGYLKLPAQQITIAENGERVATFKLAPEPGQPAGPAARVERKEAAPVAPQPTAEAIEGQDWERVRNSNDATQLQNFLRSHPNGPHARQAEQRIADLAWSSVDAANIESVRKFVREQPGNPHKVDAQKILDQYDAEQQRIAQERTRQEQAAQDRVKQDRAKQEQARQEQARQEQASREQAGQNDVRKQQVIGVLKQLDSALQRRRARDIKAIWPSVSQLFLDAVGNSHVKMSLAISPDNVRAADGSDRAVAQCDLVTVIEATSKHQKATITLRNAGGAWTIESAKVE